MLALRQLILETAADLPEVGRVDEALRWGQPSFITGESKSGTPIRLGQVKEQPDHAAVFFHCQTNLIGRIRREFGSVFEYSGNRAVLLPVAEELPVQALKAVMAKALLYHRDRSGQRGRKRH